MQDLTIEFIMYMVAIIGVGVFIWMAPALLAPPLSSAAVILGLALMGVFLGYFIGS